MGNDIDKELAEAAGLGEATDGTSSSVAKETSDSESMTVSARPPAAPKKRSVLLLATLLTMVAGILGLFMFGIDDVEVYSMPLAKFTANQAKYEGRRVRIEGELVPGSLKRRDDPCEYRFVLRDGDARLDVRFPQCVVPEAFRDVPEGGVEVTAEGKMNTDHFEASSILAKCSSKYDAKTHTLAGEPASSGGPLNEAPPVSP
jgi:cytochrome c-type biogenesis protein CcmE